ncbi:MAG: aldehyde dehydrogenase family protein [Phycisphaerales bacterium]|nr:MAG: aldehyde dehydrogenase family protein [Phycisphaerales bacterium]
MSTRLEVTKTYKLFIGGKFPRTESGRSLKIESAEGEVLAHLCHASRKDLRDAVEAAAKAQPGWGGATPYNRGQVLYRMAEMMEGKREEFAEAILATSKSRARPKRLAATRRGALNEVDATIDRLVCFGGWADKYAQVLGCNNPVAGPHYNFTVPEPTGIVGVVAPDEPPLLGLISLIAPPLCAGNAVIAISSDLHPLPAAILGEVCATSDVPAGVVNILTGQRNELLEHLANHREVNAISAANLSRQAKATLELGAAENVKRVRVDTIREEEWLDEDVCHSPWRIEPFVEMKTIWHPSAT